MGLPHTITEWQAVAVLQEKPGAQVFSPLISDASWPSQHNLDLSNLPVFGP